MKSIIFKLLVVLALLPMTLQADITSDMADPNLTLTQIIQNALNDEMNPMTIDEIIKEMIALDSDQSTAIIATAFDMVPASYEAIVDGALEAGIPAADVVVIAMVRTPDNMNTQVANYVRNAAPADQKGAVSKAIAVTRKELKKDKDTGQGGGSVSEEVAVILQLLTDIDKVGIGSPAGGPPV